MYEIGLVVALLGWVWNLAWLAVMLNSTLERNLRRVGMCLSWATLRPKEMTAKDRQRSRLGACLKYLVIAIAGLPFILLSWGFVAWQVGIYLYRRQKDAGRPAAAREFDWKLRNIDMSFDQLAKELYALNSTLGLEQAPFDHFRNGLWQQAAGQTATY
jgi:hypothetical protein